MKALNWIIPAVIVIVIYYTYRKANTVNAATAPLMTESKGAAFIPALVKDSQTGAVVAVMHGRNMTGRPIYVEGYGWVPPGSAY